jgi:hypothetical protein
MGANVGFIPVVCVRQEDDRRPLGGQDVSDRLDCSGPPLRLLFPSDRVDALQAPFSGRYQTETYVVAAAFQLLPAFSLPPRESYSGFPIHEPGSEPKFETRNDAPLMSRDAVDDCGSRQ